MTTENELEQVTMADDEVIELAKELLAMFPERDRGNSRGILGALSGLIEIAQRMQELQSDNDKLRGVLKAAIDFINLSPGDPDIYPEQMEAYTKYLGKVDEAESILKEIGEE